MQLRNLLFVCLFVLVSCQSQVQTENLVETESNELLSPADAYLLEVFKIVEINALNRNEVDWSALKGKVFEREDDSASPSDVYDSIHYILQNLNDQHSHFWDPSQANEFKTKAVDFSTEPWGKLVAGKYAYLWNGVFSSGNQDAINHYANQLQQLVIDLDAQSPCAWVLDFRDNSGGTVFPMLAGLGELYGDGLAVIAVDSYGNTIEFNYENGELWEDGVSKAKASRPDFSLSEDQPTIALLIGPRTASSGELTVLAFEGIPNVVTFGHDTAGLTTANQTFELSDGALLFLTTAVFGDRTGHTYGGKIMPDYPLSDSVTSNGTIPSEVMNWLEENSPCER